MARRNRLRAVADEQHGALTTVVDTLWASGGPIGSMTVGELARVGATPSALWYAGFPKTAATVGLASEVARRTAPQLLLSPNR